MKSKYRRYSAKEMAASKPSKTEGWLRNNEHTLKFIVSLLAACFALSQYYFHITENRVQKTLEFYERYTKEPIAKTKMDYDLIMSKVISQLINKPKPPTDQQSRREWMDTVISQTVKETVLRTGISMFIDFFDSLQVCIETSICDKLSAQALMRQDAKRIFTNSAPYIAYMRNPPNNDISYAAKTEEFIGGCGSCIEIYTELLKKPVGHNGAVMPESGLAVDIATSRQQ